MARIKKEDKQETLPITLTDQHGNITAEYTAEMVDTIKNTVAVNATDSELIMFLSVANKYDLDPFLHEIYFAKYKDKSQIIAGRDGYRKIAKRQPTFKKCQSMVVCANDEFEMEMKLGEIVDIKHKFTHKERGRPYGAYAILTTTNGDTLVSYVDITEYDTKQNAWKKYKSAMLKKVAETEVYKSFADISGLQAEEAMPSPYSRERNVNESQEEDLNEEYTIDVNLKED